MNKNRRRALITGATGYIGSQLVMHLVKLGWQVHIVARAQSDLAVLEPVLAELTVHRHDGTAQGMIDLVGRARPDYVYHLASLFLGQHDASQLDPLILSNVLFAAQLAEATVANGVKYLINTGTSWQHHNNQQYKPVNLYAATKQAFESILEYYVDAAGLKVTTLALFDTYGPADPRNKLISLLWKTALTQQAIAMSPGEQLIDLVHIDDVLAAFMIATDAVEAQPAGHSRYGVSSGAPLKLRNLVDLFASATGLDVPITWGGRSYRPREVMVPWTAYPVLPGWAPRIAFEDGIPQTRPAEHPGR